jgi:alkylation response protein AidB-like acyl-CoA dehydrogenase/aminoglycoside phosphotransferase (APT) family kinase protein
VWSKQVHAVVDRARAKDLAAELQSIPEDLQFLMDNLPASTPSGPGPVCLVHGDYRLDNVIVANTKPAVNAVLDWELSTLGHPLVDLAHCMLPFYLPFIPGSPISGFGHATTATQLMAGGTDARVNGAAAGDASGGAALDQMGIPRPQQLVTDYAGAMGGSSGGSELQPHLRCLTARIGADGMPSGWDFYLSVAFFRAAAILHGVYARSLAGNASAANAQGVGQLAGLMASRGANHLRAHTAACPPLSTGAQAQPDEAPPAAPATAGGTGAAPSSGGSALDHREGWGMGGGSLPLPQTHGGGSGEWYRSDARRGDAKGGPASRVRATRPNEQLSIPPMSERARGVLGQVREFMHERVIKQERTMLNHAESSEDRWGPHSQVEALRREARAAGLWNLFMPPHADPHRRWSPGFTVREYAPMAEEMGRSVLGPEAFNCQAPDSGNMEVLAMYGSPAQQDRWLEPLAAGRIRSCFGMTERGVASSNATNIEALVEHGVGGDASRIAARGSKWWTTGALHPDCKIMIFLGRDVTAGADAARLKADAERYGRRDRHSMVLVPMDHAGVRAERHLKVFGYDDAPHGHAEMSVDAELDAEDALLVRRGAGADIAQGRLGPGRVHHCMRLVGMSERAIEMAADRCMQRAPRRRLLGEEGAAQMELGKMRCQVEAARLITLNAAAMIDAEGNGAAAKAVSLIKAFVPSAAASVVDSAMQMHGAGGLSQDTPLAQLWSWARALRLADGPDEVHWITVGRSELHDERV